jgi:hypothetical protein
MSIYNELHFASKNKNSIYRYLGMQGAIGISQKRGGPKKTTPSGAEDQLNINQSGSEAPTPY